MMYRYKYAMVLNVEIQKCDVGIALKRYIIVAMHIWPTNVLTGRRNVTMSNN